VGWFGGEFAATAATEMRGGVIGGAAQFIGADSARAGVGIGQTHGFAISREGADLHSAAGALGADAPALIEAKERAEREKNQHHDDEEEQTRD